MWSLWIMASGEYGIRTDYGMYRAAVDLVAVMKGALSDNMEELSNAEMKEKLNESKVGILRPDKDAQHVIPWDWTEEYEDKHKPSLKARLGAIFNSIVYKMG
ncbi:hypothetical protein DIS24_g12418 [Lasiodiplodia hormozganensis]|uniref:Uncharacterized protein n=1 Tax=Lasiodiplodia hormozganensis TaxID=869390 RepID=A0AA39U1U3_9PEZI|nr:hypothetical protein DIS24_g12418 [Lasiodiplodia hormozganensis]